MAAWDARSLLCACVPNHTVEHFLTWFKCCVVFNLVIAIGYGFEALTNYLASAVAAVFLLDTALLVWLASFALRSFGSRKLQCLACLSTATSAVALSAAVGLQVYAFWLGELWEESAAVLTFTLFVCVFKTMTLPAANSFRLWRTAGKATQGSFSPRNPRDSVATALTPQEYPSDSLVSQESLA